MTAGAEPTGRNNRDDAESDRFTDHAVTIAILAGLALLAWKLSHLLLVVFAAIVVATILRSLGEACARLLPLPTVCRPILAALLILAAVVGTVLLFGAEIEQQLTQLARQLPEAAGNLVQTIRASPLVAALPWNDMTSAVASYVPTVGTVVVATLTDIVLIVIGGLFIATDPSLYWRGAVMMLPHAWRPRARAALETSGLALNQWLRGQLMLMVFVAITVGVGLRLIGVPSYLGLALIAGLTEFIPYLGPFLGAFPAILIAYATDWQTAAWTAGLFLAVQQLENNLLQPLVARRMISVPPALGLFAVVAFGTLFGGLGFMLAVPLTVVTMVLVTKLYLQHELGEDIAAPGESPQAAAAAVAQSRQPLA